MTTTAPEQQRYIPTLHHLEHAASHRCLWALEELKEAYGTEYKLKTYPRTVEPPEGARDIWPMGKFPMMTLENNPANPETNSQPLPTIQVKPGVLTEALLILRWLGEEYDTGDTKIWGNTQSESDRRRDEFFQTFAVGTLLPKIDFLVIVESISSFLPIGLSGGVRLLFSPVKKFWMENGVNLAFQSLEESLTGEGEEEGGMKKPWLAGSKLGIADLNASFGIDMAAQRGYLDPKKFPKLAQWHERVKARPGYQRALEKGGGYNLKTFGM